jgi:hypothetical protein
MCERRSPELAAAGVVYIAARPPQIKTLEQQEVLISPALPQGTTLAIARHAVVSALGPMRVEATRKGDRVRLRFCGATTLLILS